ncbi:MAG TPA: NAD(P)H-binding protein [Bryobacteraceae bacterium]|jgi:uncharacterized protein YbjT (DUF2867 family)
MNRILVIGGTGTVGSEVVRQLVQIGGSVRALARKPEAARMPSGVEVVRGDLTAPESLESPLEGIDAVFLVWTAPFSAFAPVLERIARHARRIVYLSAPLKTQHPLFQQPNAARAMAERNEGLIEACGLEWTFLRPGMFASNARFWWGPQIRSGDVVRWPYLEAPTAPIDPRDIAAVGVRALTENGHAGAEYVITGPDSLTQREQISVIGEAIGRRLRIEEITPDEARREWVARYPGTEAVINMLMTAWAAAVGQPAFVTSSVQEVTGSAARTFRAWAADHTAEFRASSHG